MPTNLTDADNASIDERLRDIFAAASVEAITASVGRFMALLSSLDPELVFENMPPGTALGAERGDPGLGWWVGTTAIAVSTQGSAVGMRAKDRMLSISG